MSTKIAQSRSLMHLLQATIGWCVNADLLELYVAILLDCRMSTVCTIISGHAWCSMRDTDRMSSMSTVELKFLSMTAVSLHQCARVSRKTKPSLQVSLCFEGIVPLERY